MNSTKNSTAVYAYPISTLQKRIWILSKFGKTSAAYNMTGVLKLDGPLNIDIFQQCVNHIVNRHETLRTVFKDIDGEIKQLINEDHHVKVEYSKVNSEDEIKQKVIQKASHHFDLETGPLINISVLEEHSSRFTIIISMHHIISDGWSISIFIKECTEIYNNLINNRPFSLEELEIQYADYTVWEKEQIELGAHDKQINYWRNQLENAPELLELPYIKDRPNYQTFNGDLYTVKLTKALTDKIQQLCVKYKVSPFMLFLSVYKIALHKYSGQSDLLVGTPTANRNSKELENVIGFFVNTLVIRTRIDEKKTFADHLARVKEISLNSIENKDVSFETVLNLVQPRRNTSYHPIFQVMFSMENLPSEQLFIGETPVRIEKPETIFSKFDLTLSVRQSNDVYELEYEYNTSLFDHQMIENFNNHYTVILSQVLDDPTLKIADIDLLTVEEEKQVLNQLNSTPQYYPKDSTLIAQFEKQVKKTPGNIAFEFRDVHFTYKELDDYTNQLANCLHNKGINKHDTVALYIERDKNLLPALLAVLKTGANYIPLDPTYPLQRIEYIINDARLKWLLTNTNSKNIFENVNGLNILAIEELSVDQQPKNKVEDQSIESTWPMYTIYTSGSTGRPKGVRISHRSLLNFLYSMKETPGFNETDKLLCVTSLAFDISGLELYLPLITGGTMVLASETEIKSAYRLVDVINDTGITVVQATPSLWKMLKEIDASFTRSIKVLCGGEAFPPNLAEWILNISDNVWNMYGPTETTIWSSIAKIEDAENITIGTPVNNTSMYILDKSMNPLPRGIKGDLYIGGDGLAIDYYNRPDLVAERFIEWSYKNKTERIYKTGDIASYNHDGTIHFFGREDYQVKVNGYRIELGEVENGLLKVDGVEQAAANVVDDPSGTKLLVGYVQVKQGQPVEDIRNSLLHFLPSYMVPSKIVTLEKMPLTPNGKIDRKSLPVIDIKTNESTQDYVEPITTTEIALSSIWSEVLGVEKIGTKDNFFSLGGASLQSVRITSLAEKSGIIISPELIFEFPTIGELSEKAELLTGLNTGSSRIKQEEIKLPVDIEPEETGSQEKSTNIIVESMGMYLPQKEVKAQEIVEHCKNKIRFPIERLTGIKSVRYVQDEYNLGLAYRAVEECLSVSKYKPEAIDLVISCNIFRMKSEKSIAIEPSMSIQLKKKFGFKNALTFDITNACTGIFTAIYLAESFIKSGVAGRCLVFSGEYISHLTKTSQLEVENYMDTKIAGLTLGDAGFALIIENSEEKKIGFHELDLFTMGEYSNLCIVKPSDNSHGGFVVRTDAIKMGEAGHAVGANHALRSIARKKWQKDNIDHIIMHQASSTTTQNAMKEINRVFKEEITSNKNVIDNIKYRGNTATTTHWVATMDSILNGTINDNDNIVYCISGSGLSLGTALYTFDNLPSRIKKYKETCLPVDKVENISRLKTLEAVNKTIRINSLGFVPKTTDNESGLEMLYKATEISLKKANGVDTKDIDKLIFYGIHRDQYIYEPATSTFLAGQFGINSSTEDVKDGKTSFAFDILNGSLGFLNACYILLQLVRSGKCKKALLAGSEFDNTKQSFPENNPTIFEAGATLLLEESTREASGFGEFVFDDFVEYIDDKKEWAEWDNEKVIGHVFNDTRNHSEYARLVVGLIEKLLEKEKLGMDKINIILPPLISNEFYHAFKNNVLFRNWDGKWLDYNENIGDSSMTTAYQLNYIYENNMVKPGDIGIIINMASGLQVGAAIYYF